MSEGANLDFYAVSAQVMATLVIGLAIGIRELRPVRSWLMTFIALELVLALIGTWQAVLVLIDGDPSGTQESIVRWSLGFVCFGFIGLVLRWFTHPDDWHGGRWWRFNQSQAAPSSQPGGPSRPRRSVAVLAAAVIAYLLGRGLRR
jgi:hypothetical protein